MSTLLVGHDVELRSSDEATLMVEIGAEADGPLAADLLLALLHHRDEDVAGRLAVHVIRSTSDPGTMAEIASALTRAENLVRYVRIGRELLLKATDRALHHGVRGHALFAAMVLAQHERRLYHALCGVLLDVEVGDDGQYLRHVARVMGIVLSHNGEMELRQRLYDLLSIEAAADEAALELGCEALRRALVARAAGEARGAVIEAKSWFERSMATSEYRPDAELLAHCAQMLLGFDEGSIGESARDKVTELRRSAFAWSAYLTSSDRPAGVQACVASRELERIGWSNLALRLGQLEDSLTKSVWLEAVRIIEDEVVTVFTASRTFFARDDGGIETLVAPRLFSGLGRERLYLDYLDEWLKEYRGDGRAEDVGRLRAAVTAAREGSVGRHPTSAAVPESGIAALSSMFERIAGRGEAGRVLLNATAMAADQMSPIMNELLRTTTAGLRANAYYRGETRNFVDAVLLQTLRYLESRHDLSVASAAYVQFLFNRGHGPQPVEKELQQDYYGALSLSPLRLGFTAEARDLGGGRVDVLFSSNGIRLSAELKREESDRSDAELIDHYGPQAMTYQGTNVPICFLLVLDLHDRGGEQAPLKEQISVHHRTPSASRTPHTIVLARIQGKRKRPSELSF